MIRILFFLLTISLLSCNNSSQVNDGKTAKAAANVNAKAKEVKQAVTPVKSVPAAKQDSIKPKRQRNYTLSTSRPKAEIDATFPFDLDLKTADGKTLKSSDILKKNGKPTVVLFWLTTCYPCKIEMANIQKVYDSWKAETDFNLVAISTDFAKNYGRFSEMVKTKNWPWEAYNDVNREFRLVLPGGLNGLPQTFVFDKNGEIAYHKRKYATGDEHKLYEKVKELAAM